MNVLSDQQFNFYWENGYLILKDIFSESEVKNICNTLGYHADTEWSNILNPDREEFLISYNTKKLQSYSNLIDKVDYIKKCKSTSKIIRNILKDIRIVTPLEKLYTCEMSGLSTHMI